MFVESLDDKNNGLGRYLAFAVGIHLSVCIFFYIFAVIRGTTLTDSLLKKNQLQFIKTSVRVDVVSMPKLTIKELKMIMPDDEVMEKGPAIEQEDTIKEEDIVFEKKKKKKNLLSFLKNMSEKDIPKVKPKKIEKTKNKPKGIGSISSKDLKKLTYFGNRISTGTSAYGDGADEAIKGVFGSYVESLPDHVRPYWRLPGYLKEQADLRCRIRIYLSSDGTLLKAVVFEESGVAEYDQLAMKAVKNAAPYPMPESQIVSRVVTGEILLGFPL